MKKLQTQFDNTCYISGVQPHFLCRQIHHNCDNKGFADATFATIVTKRLSPLLSEFERYAVTLPLELIHFWTIVCCQIYVVTRLDNTALYNTNKGIVHKQRHFYDIFQLKCEYCHKFLNTHTQRYKCIRYTYAELENNFKVRILACIISLIIYCWFIPSIRIIT